MAERKSLAEMASEAAGHNGHGPACPKCGCGDLLAYRTTQMQSSTVRYRHCRHCGTSVLTRQQPETIIRTVNRYSG